MSSQALILGAQTIDAAVLSKVAREFGWEVGVARDPGMIAANLPGKVPLAVFYHPSAVGFDCNWVEATRRLARMLPGVRLIACHGFSEAMDWSSVHAAGAFHDLSLPLKENEVRQSLGFILDAQKRLADASATLLMRHRTHGLSIVARRKAS
jgi:hypothetical protein